MSKLTLRSGCWGLACWAAFLWAGCGKSEKSETETTADAPAGGKTPVTAAIGAPVPADDDADEDDDVEAAKIEPKEGSPEWLVREATKLRLEPPPKTEDLEKLRVHRKERNEKIVKLCQEAIAAVHADTGKERLFTAAVHNMLEARLQLAMSGDRDSIDALYEDAAALYKRDPKSAAAAEGAYALTNLAYGQAKAGTGNNPQWIGEFARQATHFVENFPAEERRSLPLLFTAALGCEVAGMTKEALDGYTLIQQKFPQSPYASRVAGVLRRLKLIGNPPHLSGPTLDGEPVVLDDLLGSPVLVVFWASDSKPFLDGLPGLLKVTRPHAKSGLKVIGVNLDAEPTAASQFVRKHKIAWPQIVFPEPEKRFNNPIVGYYGIMQVPAFWLIDHSGNVVSTTVTVETLDFEVRKLIAAGASSAPEPSGADEDPDPNPPARPRTKKSAGKPQPAEEEE